jgi:acyl dehydratase
VGLYFEDYEALTVGHRWVGPSRTIGESDITTFAGLTGDHHPQHTDARYAAASPYGERIAHGYLTASMAAGLAYRIGIDEGTSHAILEMRWTFSAPVKIGDTLSVVLTLTAVRASRKHPAMGIVSRRCSVQNQNDATVADGDITILCKRRDTPPPSDGID